MGIPDITRRFPVGVQLTLPADYRRDKEFCAVLSLAKERRLAELELNILEPGRVDRDELAEHLGQFGLSMTRLASGAFARVRGLSLSSADERLRRKSVAMSAELIRYAASFPAEVVIGLLKGAAEPDQSAARERFTLSLSELAETCGAGPIPVLLEATNRYESSVANTLEEASRFASGYAARGMKILPDTFHMNIEESDGRAALGRFRGFYHSVHISDNNRLLPGFGQLDFAPIFKALTDAGYTGSLVIEGNVRGSLVEDLGASIRYVDGLLGSLP